MTEEKELQPVDIEWEAEKICRWGAARAGVIVVAPLVGTMALMANEVYMIMRLGELRGVKLEESAVLGLLTSLGATFVGQTLVTLIPIAPIQVPVGVSVTYAVGKAANAWIKAGRPEDIAEFREVYESARKEGMKHSEDFEKMDCKDTPLGDESKRFELRELKEALRNKSGNLFSKMMKSWIMCVKAWPAANLHYSLWLMPSLICCGWSCSIQRTALWSCCCRSRCLMSMPNLLLQG